MSCWTTSTRTNRNTTAGSRAIPACISTTPPTRASGSIKSSAGSVSSVGGPCRGASFTSVPQLREAIDRFVKTYNAHATPFEWRKRVVHSVGLKHCYADLRS